MLHPADSWALGSSDGPVPTSFEDRLVYIFSLILEGKAGEIELMEQGLENFLETGELGVLADLIPETLRNDLPALGIAGLNLVTTHLSVRMTRLTNERENIFSILDSIIKALNKTTEKALESMGKG